MSIEVRIAEEGSDSTNFYSRDHFNDCRHILSRLSMARADSIVSRGMAFVVSRGD